MQLMSQIPTSLTSTDIPSTTSQSVARSARRLLILPQAKEELPKLSLTSALRAPTLALTRKIDQLPDSFPAGSTTSRVLPVLEELVGLLARLRHLLVALVVVVVVEVVDGLLRRFDRLGFACPRHFVPVCDGHVATLAPFADDFGLGLFGLLLAAEGRLGLRWVVGERVACDGAAGGYGLFVVCMSVLR